PKQTWRPLAATCKSGTFSTAALQYDGPSSQAGDPFHTACIGAVRGAIAAGGQFMDPLEFLLNMH
ncbi:MAG: hypothetical protein NTZ54_14170, partial [Alphaproteobacteria bacterium]|nr:hypothetical protein [Alphaproteobacteria bacterium]